MEFMRSFLFEEQRMSRFPLLSQEEVEERLDRLPNWQQKDNTIEHERTLTNFAAAIGFINAVALLSEKADHHPNILLYGWNHVRITLYTHDKNGLTDHDFNLARQIGELE